MHAASGAGWSTLRDRLYKSLARLKNSLEAGECGIGRLRYRRLNYKLLT